MAASSSGKRAKKDPVVAKVTAVAEALDEAEQVSKSVRSMLSGMAYESLSTYVDVRHEFQARAVGMIGEALGGLEAGIQKSIEEAQAKVDNAEEEKAKRAAAKTAAEEALAALEADVTEKKAALAAAEAAAKEGKAALTAASKAVESLAPEIEATQEEVVEAKERLESLKMGALAAFSELKDRATPPPEPEEPVVEEPVAVEEPPAPAV
jgi:chromosome segregation ATPase